MVNETTRRRPNVVLLMADQHRHDMLGGDHDAVITPHIDRLAAEGARFTNTYCLGPLCMPARTSFISERYVRDHGVDDNDHELDPTSPTFLTSLVDAGYTTTCIGKMHLWIHAGLRKIEGARPTSDTRARAEQMRAYGFTEPIETVGKLATGAIDSEYSDFLAAHDLLERYRDWVRSRYYFSNGRHTTLPNWTTGSAPVPDDAYIDTWHGHRAVRWIEERDDDRPFFLWVGFPGPHDPWDAPPVWADRYDPASLPQPGSSVPPEPTPWAPRFSRFLDYWKRFSDSDELTSDRVSDVRRHYLGNVTAIDHAVGAIRAALERSGRLEDTWIIYTSDHGEMLGEHRLLMKMVFYDAATKVPLIVRPPDGTALGEFDDLVEQFDLAATIRRIADATGHPQFEGRPIPHLPTSASDSPPTAGRDVVWSENFGMGMARTDRWKLTFDEDDAAPAQLFDLRDDPHEDENLVPTAGGRRLTDDLMAEYVRPFLATREPSSRRRF